MYFKLLLFVSFHRKNYMLSYNYRNAANKDIIIQKDTNNYNANNTICIIQVYNKGYILVRCRLKNLLVKEHTRYLGIFDI